MKGERHHRARLLQNPENAGLQVLAGQVATLQRIGRAHEVEKMGLHRTARLSA